MAKVLEVDTDLVGAMPGVEDGFEQRRAAEAFPDHVAGPRLASAPIRHGHPLAVCWVAGDGGTDFPTVAGGLAADNGKINFVHGPACELIREGGVSGVILRHHQAAAGFLVEPMDDARPRDAADAAELTGAMMQQRVDQRVLLMAGRRMHDQTRRLVEHQQVLVLVKYFQRNLLGPRFGRSRFGPMYVDLLTRAGMVRGFDGAPVHANMAFLDKALDGAARDGGEPVAQRSWSSRPRRGRGLLQ